MKKTLDLWALKHLALCLDISEDELITVSENTKKYYFSWKKPKKDGTFREISDTAPRLKIIQKKLHQLLKKVVLSDAAHGGVPGRTNQSNADAHCGESFIYKLDFRSYFPSISHQRVFHLFRHELNCSNDVASLLTKLTTINGCVPQGSSTSMDIANLVCRNLDAWLIGLSKSFGLKYTRYVDDLTFSGKHIPERFKKKLKKIIKLKQWLYLNDSKESLNGKNQEQIVTGLNIKYKKPKITRAYKRSVKKEKHILSKLSANELNDTELENSKSSVKGKENYILHIEGAGTNG
ncbi:MAG: RNA-directed DNA polymerase [Desulfobacteraceae bacterium]|nr:RNA-directed DNA polymerase [Desulfobacteraceae bacterium]MBC2756299.1 RNA-directed DNA polymerase [Desulfobacteraceae bacterium]